MKNQVYVFISKEIKSCNYCCFCDDILEHGETSGEFSCCHPEREKDMRVTRYVYRVYGRPKNCPLRSKLTAVEKYNLLKGE